MLKPNYWFQYLLYILHLFMNIELFVDYLNDLWLITFGWRDRTVRKANAAHNWHWRGRLVIYISCAQSGNWVPRYAVTLLLDRSKLATQQISHAASRPNIHIDRQLTHRPCSHEGQGTHMVSPTICSRFTKAAERECQIGRASCRERVSSPCRSRWSPYH